MRVRLPAIAVASLAFAACGGGGGASPAGLAYDIPDPATLTYITGDTTVIDIDAMGQTMQMNQASEATWSAAFARAADGVEVTMTVMDLAASMTQPMGAPMTATESGIDGPIVMTLSRTGEATIGSLPEVSGNAEALFAPMSTAYAFWPGLPGTGVGPGDTWSDTLSYSGAEGPGETEATIMATYEVVGDTVVDGRSLVKILIEGSVASDTQANMQGMDVFQSLTGTIDGYMLWDMNAGVMFERYLATDGSGSVEVAVAPAPMSLSARGESWTRLQSN